MYFGAIPYPTEKLLKMSRWSMEDVLWEREGEEGLEMLTKQLIRIRGQGFPSYQTFIHCLTSGLSIHSHPDKSLS
jgi:hypothetical protein